MHIHQSLNPDRFAINGVMTRFGDKRTANMMHRGIMELARAAYAHQGTDAFIQTKKAAAFQEAGHAVVATAFLETVTRVKISRDHLLSQWRWTGLTSYDDQDWLSDEYSTPLEDAINGMVCLAGVASGMFFKADYRSGSSLDEILQFRGLVINVAMKMNLRPIEAIRLAIRLRRMVFGILQKNVSVVRNIANKLMLHKVLRRRAFGPAVEERGN